MGGVNRAEVALRPPGDDLGGFPTRRISTRRNLYRVHRSERGPWFFGSSGGGRFDLRDGRGTCYLALDRRTAIREVVGAELHDQGVLPANFLAERMLSRLRPPAPWSVADLCHDTAADYGVTREIHTLTPYSVPQAWAAELDRLVDGLLYQTRFTTAAGPNGLAIFGAAGAVDWPADTAPIPLTLAARSEGITIARQPRTARIVRPPRRP